MCRSRAPQRWASRVTRDDPSPNKQAKKCTADSSRRSPNWISAKPTKREKKVVTSSKTFKVQSRNDSSAADGRIRTDTRGRRKSGASQEKKLTRKCPVPPRLNTNRHRNSVNALDHHCVLWGYLDTEHLDSHVTVLNFEKTNAGGYEFPC